MKIPAKVDRFPEDLCEIDGKTGRDACSIQRSVDRPVHQQLARTLDCQRARRYRPARNGVVQGDFDPHTVIDSQRHNEWRAVRAKVDAETMARSKAAQVVFNRQCQCDFGPCLRIHVREREKHVQCVTRLDRRLPRRRGEGLNKRHQIIWLGPFECGKLRRLKSGRKHIRHRLARCVDAWSIERFGRTVQGFRSLGKDVLGRRLQDQSPARYRADRCRGHCRSQNDMPQFQDSALSVLFCIARLIFGTANSRGS